MPVILAMKRITVILLVLLMSIGNIAGRNVRKAQIAGVISEFRGCEGVEVVQLGSLATSALRATIRLSSPGDPDALQALSMMKGIRRLTIFEFEDSSEAVKKKICHKLDKAFEGAELLMEAKDGTDSMKLYGVLNEKSDTVSDLMMYAPGDCALICIFGKVSMDAIAEIMKDND